MQNTLMLMEIVSGSIAGAGLGQGITASVCTSRAHTSNHSLSLTSQPSHTQVGCCLSAIIQSQESYNIRHLMPGTDRFLIRILLPDRIQSIDHQINLRGNKLTLCPRDSSKAREPYGCIFYQASRLFLSCEGKEGSAPQLGFERILPIKAYTLDANSKGVDPSLPTALRFLEGCRPSRMLVAKIDAASLCRGLNSEKGLLGLMEGRRRPKPKSSASLL